MALTQKAKDTYKILAGSDPIPSPTDPELLEILQNEIFGEVFSTQGLTIKEREILTVVTLSCLQTLNQLRSHTNFALNVGNEPIVIREAVYQCAPYIGWPRTLSAMAVINKVFEARGIALPLENAGTVAYEDREAAGAAIQVPRYGDEVKAVFAKLPGEYGTFVPHLLTAVGFGDFQTRGILSDADKELIDLIALVAIGAATQIKPHINGAVLAGNSLEKITAAIVQILPYVGFPTALSALIQVANYNPEASQEAYR